MAEPPALLLDTHAFLWWVADDPRLGPRAREAIADATTTVFVSAVSSLEIAIKAQLGKLELALAPGTFVSRELRRNAFVELPLASHHALAVFELRLHHRDPFDRALAAQALCEALPLVTGDPAFAPYRLDTVW